MEQVRPMHLKGCERVTIDGNRKLVDVFTKDGSIAGRAVRYTFEDEDRLVTYLTANKIPYSQRGEIDEVTQNRFGELVMFFYDPCSELSVDSLDWMAESMSVDQLRKLGLRVINGTLEVHIRRYHGGFQAVTSDGETFTMANLTDLVDQVMEENGDSEFSFTFDID